MNKKEHFVITTDAAHIDSLSEAKEQGQHEVNKLMAIDNQPRVYFDESGFHPRVGNYTHKRVINGSFRGYETREEAEEKAQEFAEHYKKVNNLYKGYVKYLRFYRDYPVRTYECPKCERKLNNVMHEANFANIDLKFFSAVCPYCAELHFLRITKDSIEAEMIPECIEDE